MEEIPLGLWELAPIPALIGAVMALYWLLATGRLVPRSSHERELAHQKERADEWKETALDQRAVKQEIREQNTMLMETARITSKFFAEVETDVEDTRTG